ncbi:MAG: hypothetical protein ABMA64_28150 [Myxococcota bacterium]
MFLVIVHRRWGSLPILVGVVAAFAGACGGIGWGRGGPPFLVVLGLGALLVAAVGGGRLWRAMNSPGRRSRPWEWVIDSPFDTHSPFDSLMCVQLPWWSIALVGLALAASQIPDAPPVLPDAGPDQEASIDTRVQLDGTGSLRAGHADLGFHWTLVDGPPGSEARLDRPDHPLPTFVPDRAGTYLLELTVTEGSAPVGTDRVEVAVR